MESSQTSATKRSNAIDDGDDSRTDWSAQALRYQRRLRWKISNSVSDMRAMFRDRTVRDDRGSITNYSALVCLSMQLLYESIHQAHGDFLRSIQDPWCRWPIEDRLSLEARMRHENCRAVNELSNILFRPVADTSQTRPSPPPPSRGRRSGRERICRPRSKRTDRRAKPYPLPCPKHPDPSSSSSSRPSSPRRIDREGIRSIVVSTLSQLSKQTPFATVSIHNRRSSAPPSDGIQLSGTSIPSLSRLSPSPSSSSPSSSSMCLSSSIRSEATPRAGGREKENRRGSGS